MLKRLPILALSSDLERSDHDEAEGDHDEETTIEDLMHKYAGNSDASDEIMES